MCSVNETVHAYQEDQTAAASNAVNLWNNIKKKQGSTCEKIQVIPYLVGGGDVPARDHLEGLSYRLVLPQTEAKDGDQVTDDRLCGWSILFYEKSR